MTFLTRQLIIDTLIKHETLTITDLANPVHLGMHPDRGQLNFLLAELKKCGQVDILNGVTPKTFTITDKGIAEGRRLQMA